MFNLLKIGLTEGEAKVYLALSELGSSTVGPIVKKSRVAYSNIYDILQQFVDGLENLCRLQRMGFDYSKLLIR